MKRNKATAVQCTNDSSTMSKCSMASRGYLQHDFLKCFIKKQSFRSPLINRGYYVRVKCLHTIMLSFFDVQLSNSTAEKCQIVSFGAGFDSTYFQLKSEGNLPSNCIYVEIDFIEVVKKKLACIQKSTLIDMILPSRIFNSGEIVISSHDYVLIGIDLKDISRLTVIFEEIGICYFVPTLFLSECAIIYMDVISSNNLIHWTANKFSNAIFITYEQVCPADGFGRIMQQHFSSIGSPLKSIESFSTVASQQERYQHLGWTMSFAINMNKFYNSLPHEERKRVSSLEVFDEFEEWHLKCSHYVTVIACQGSLLSLGANLLTAFKINTGDIPKIRYIQTVEWEQLPVCPLLQRFGHKTTTVSKHIIGISGGFGQMKGKHQRMNDIVLYDLNSRKCCSYIISHNEIGIETRYMHHSLIPLLCGCLIIMGGRSSPMKSWKEVLLLCPSSQYNDSIKDHVTHGKVIWATDEILPYASIDVTSSVISTFVQTSGNSPCSRWRHTATYILRKGAESIVVYGGCNLQYAALGDCFILSVPIWQWTQIKTDIEIIVPRHSHATSVWNSAIIVSCGLDEDSQPLNTVLMLEIESYSWTELPVVGLLPRYSHTSHVWKDKLLILGGVNFSSEFYPGVAVINLLNYEAHEIKLPIQDPEYPILLHKHSSELIPDTDKIIITGGGGNCFSFGTHLNHHPLLLPLEQFNIFV